jgi:hypothetical protein
LRRTRIIVTAPVIAAALVLVIAWPAAALTAGLLAELRRTCVIVPAPVVAAAPVLILAWPATALTSGLLAKIAALAVFAATSATPALITAAASVFIAAATLVSAALRTAAIILAPLLTSFLLFLVLLLLLLILGKDDRRSGHRLRPHQTERRCREDGAKNKNSVLCADHGHFLTVREFSSERDKVFHSETPIATFSRLYHSGASEALHGT